MWAAGGLSEIDTGVALGEARRHITSALATIAGRKAEWRSILLTSADYYRDTDVTAARRLAALGDLNRPPTS